MTPTFMNPPAHYTLAEFRLMLADLKFGAWRPKFPTLHNTAVPSLARWLTYGPTPQERWGANLNRYYEGLGWHAGPHLVVCPDYVWVLCDLTEPGVSVSCWNSETIGLEMIGNYEVGGDDFASGDGAKVRDNAAAVLAALNEKFNWGDLADYAAGVRGLHFHRECTRDHHACPGSKVSKAEMLIAAAAS
jgi:N-acetylmuramoyl-L-alanine amidase